MAAASSSGFGFTPLVAVVNFHHARGPEIEAWFGADPGTDPALTNDWSLLPFMALSDGSHAASEDFSYFTLLKPATDSSAPTSLFGISCTRQIAASDLLEKSDEVTRSIVQKAVVVIADSPHLFGMFRERLSVVTNAWFAQKNFYETDILKRFQDSLKDEAERGRLHEEEDRDRHLGMSLRQLIRTFKWQTLVLFKCCLLQPKMLFFGSRCERLCMMQFSIISLIPGLIRKLQDCADPELDSYEKTLSKPTSLKTSDRNSLLTYMGLPLQIFGRGSLFGPYTPLQQLDVLADFGTKSYVVGSTNSLLLQQKDRYSDILVNLDEEAINIPSAHLRSALNLTVADRRWIDFITQSVNDTWDDANPDTPNTLGYVGSEDFIRLQFEAYLLSLVSSVKCHNFLQENADNPNVMLPTVEGDPASDFGTEWVSAWSRTANYLIWDQNTDSHIFDIVEPKHPCAGGLTIDDIQRRLAQQVKELHLDERFAVGKEVLGRNLAAGREKASTVFNRLYSDMELLREHQKTEQEGHKLLSDEHDGASVANTRSSSPDSTRTAPAGTGTNVGSKAGAYMSSWAAWAGQKKRGWSKPAPPRQEVLEEAALADFTPRDITPKASVATLRQKPRPASMMAPKTFEPSKRASFISYHEPQRPETRESFKESLYDSDAPTDDEEKEVYGTEGLISTPAGMEAGTDSPAAASYMAIPTSTFADDDVFENVAIDAPSASASNTDPSTAPVDLLEDVALDAPSAPAPSTAPPANLADDPAHGTSTPDATTAAASPTDAAVDIPPLNTKPTEVPAPTSAAASPINSAGAISPYSTSAEAAAPPTAAAAHTPDDAAASSSTTPTTATIEKPAAATAGSPASDTTVSPSTTPTPAATETPAAAPTGPKPSSTVSAMKARFEAAAAAK